MNVQRVAKMTHFESVLAHRGNRLIDFCYSCWLKMANAFFRMSRSRTSALKFLSKLANFVIERLRYWATLVDQLGLPAIDQVRVSYAKILRNRAGSRDRRVSFWTASCLNSLVKVRRDRVVDFDFRLAIVAPRGCASKHPI